VIEFNHFAAYLGIFRLIRCPEIPVLYLIYEDKKSENQEKQDKPFLILHREYPF
jgi:hypothetical protein